MNKKKKIILIIIGIGFFVGIVSSFLNIQETEPNEAPKITKLDMKMTEENPKISLPKWNQENEIVWQDNKPLVWNDFTGEVYDVEQPEASAQTNSGICVHTTQGILDTEPCYYIFTEINVGAIFTKEKSWIKPDVHQDYLTDLLKHEQGHFDISEIYARILTQKLIEETKGKGYLCPEAVTASLWTNIHKKVDQLVGKIHDEVSSEREKKDAEYETETWHGTIFEKQQEWNNIIHGCLYGTWNNLEDCFR